MDVDFPTTVLSALCSTRHGIAYLQSHASLVPSVILASFERLCRRFGVAFSPLGLDTLEPLLIGDSSSTLVGVAQLGSSDAAFETFVGVDVLRALQQLTSVHISD